MFYNYLTIALRNIVRHKLYSLINIAGLTIGLACAIFIALFVRDELSYDKWIAGTENLYRVQLAFHFPGQPPIASSLVPFPVPDAMLAQLPEVKAAAHLQSYQMTVATGERQFLDPVDVVSPNFLQIIQLPLVAGDRATLFAEPESAVITQSAARKYFGAKPALGQILKVGGQCEFGDPGISGCVIRQSTVMVRGIVRDLPHNTQLAGNVFIPNTSIANPMAPGFKKTSWLGAGGWGYVELQPGADPQSVMAKLPALLDRNVDVKKTLGLSIPAGRLEQLDLTSFRDDHLSSDNRGLSMTPAGSWATVYGSMAIGVLILLIACFNFTNLATARAMMRAREISLRKVVGARPGQLMIQFLGESTLLALVSFILALALVEMLLPLYDRMLGKPIQLLYPSAWPLLLGLFGTAILVGLLGGFYPALVLSRFRPASTLRTNAAGQSGSGLLRGLLVTMQFAVSIGLAIAALVVFAQISFARSIELGLNKDGIVVINGNGLAFSTLQSMVRALDADPRVIRATLSTAAPFSSYGAATATIEIPGRPGTSAIGDYGIGPDFFPVYGIKLLSGRSLAESHSQDLWDKDSTQANIVINQAAARYLGYSPQSALGKTLYADKPNKKVKRVRLTIVGVTTDFMFEGSSRQISPTLYAYDAVNDSKISVRIAPADVRQALSAIDRTWHGFAPSLAINRRFLDEDFEKQFLADEQQGRIFAIFVCIAIFIACLGLFGLAAFTASRRTREIGIRKAFGARTRDLVLLLLWQFSVPVLIANAIAWPVAWYYLHDWLQGFAYRIELSPLYFLGAGLAALLVAWATVILHVAQVAKANPVHALRHE
ncbi:MAG TPA: ABC transporter permease [Rhizomicrobium sp.]|nr:ABC transporter permease [Rhizomicrobium sp.]